MLERKSMKVVRKLAIFSLLAACLYVFGYSDQTQAVAAAPCIQECETNLNYCNDQSELLQRHLRRGVPGGLRRCDLLQLSAVVLADLLPVPQLRGVVPGSGCPARPLRGGLGVALPGN